MEVALGVMEKAGIGVSMAHPVLAAVFASGQGIVAHGREEDMQGLASLFAAVGMKATVRQGSAPQAEQKSAQQVKTHQLDLRATRALTASPLYNSLCG